jgi:hypothetical protein
MIPTSFSAGRRTISRASWAACAGVWIGVRFGPILTRSFAIQ